MGGSREKVSSRPCVAVVLSSKRPFMPVSESNVVVHREFDNSYMGDRLEVQTAAVRGVLACRRMWLCLGKIEVRLAIVGDGRGRAVWLHGKGNQSSWLGWS